MSYGSSKAIVVRDNKPTEKSSKINRPIPVSLDTTANPNPNPNPDKPSQSDAAQQLEIIDLLVEFGVDLRTRTKNRQTIMHVAARVGHSQMIRHIAALVRRIVPPPPRNKVKQAKRE
ncbi:hypothetical protein SARC_17153, partial [Sphaeroforma arctica JP610]